MAEIFCIGLSVYLIWREISHSRERRDLYNRIMVRDYTEYKLEKTKHKSARIFKKDR